MKRAIFLFLVFASAPAPAAADTHVRQVSSVDPYYDAVPQGGTETPVDIWFGRGRAAIITERTRVLYDRAARSLFVVSMGDSTYCEINLPVNRDSVLEPDYRARIDRWYFEGDVAAEGKTEEIAGRSCALFTGTQWIQLGDDRFNETDKAYWLANELSFDWTLHREIRDAILALARNSDAFLEAQRRFEGFALRGERIVYDQGNKITSRLETRSIAEEEASPGCYEVPAHCRKLDRLGRGMFLALLQLAY